jgi:hypothetical protein
MGSGGLAPLFLTSALDGCEWSASRPGRFTTGKELAVPNRYKARWAPKLVWTLWRRDNILPVPGIEPQPSIAIPTEVLLRSYPSVSSISQVPISLVDFPTECLTSADVNHSFTCTPELQHVAMYPFVLHVKFQWFAIRYVKLLRFALSPSRFLLYWKVAIIKSPVKAPFHFKTRHRMTPTQKFADPG